VYSVNYKRKCYIARQRGAGRGGILTAIFPMLALYVCRVLIAFLDDAKRITQRVESCFCEVPQNSRVAASLFCHSDFSAALGVTCGRVVTWGIRRRLVGVASRAFDVL